MGRITTDQSHQVMATLAVNANWDEIDFEESGLQELVVRNPKKAGTRFTAFLKNSGRVIVGEPRVIKIDRSQSFDLVKFLGKGWSIVEQDERSIVLTEVDLAKVRFETMLRGGETSVKGEEKLKRLKKAGCVCLDARVFQTLWENKELIPETWISGNIRYIHFPGTELRHPSGRRAVLCLYWRDGQWDWDCCWLDHDWPASDPSAVLASI